MDEENLHMLPFREEEFLILHWSVEEKKNLLETMVELYIIGFIVLDWLNDCTTLMFVAL